MDEYEDFRHWTLWELWGEPGIWEPFSDTPNFFPTADEAARVASAERLLWELWTEGWARFVRRPWGAPELNSSTDHELGEEEIAAAIRTGCWRSFPPVPDDANIWLVPTEKALTWKNEEARAAFGVEADVDSLSDFE